MLTGAAGLPLRPRRIGRRIEPRHFTFGDGDIFIGPHVVTDRPIDHRRIVDIDVVVDGDTNLGVTAGKTRRGIERAPGVGFRRVAHLNHTIGLPAAADFIVQRDIDDR